MVEDRWASATNTSVSTRTPRSARGMLASGAASGSISSSVAPWGSRRTAISSPGRASLMVFTASAWVWPVTSWPRMMTPRQKVSLCCTQAQKPR